MAASKSKMRLKLLIHTKDHRVLFAEAGKDFVDFLFYIFSLPVGNVVKLLRQQSMVGCIGDLYQSLKTFDRTFMQPHQRRASVLNPKSPVFATGLHLLLCDHETRKIYSCPFNFGHTYVADSPDSLCPSCLTRMTRQLSYVTPMAAAAANSGALVEGGFVKGVVTYMVMDNLQVKPMSTISSITLLNKCNVKDFSALEERIVYVGMDEGLDLLRASLECKTALTSVFLGN